ncbi:MAG: type II secretion system protein [Hyphomicrobiales bacterium]|nr:type II secretion system protein [Hyphomicrobiales bacterium]
MFRLTGLRAAYPYWKQRTHLRVAAGFTLLEVLVAFTIMALILGAVLQVFAGGLRDSALAKEYSIAALHAQSTLAVAVSDPSLLEGSESGEFDDGYRWRITVAPFDDALVENDAARPLFAQRISVAVSWGGLRERSLTLTTLRIVPVARGQIGEGQQ